MRKHWIDNLRWLIVLSVLLYHVIYFFNNKWVFGGMWGFGTFPEVQQYQDVIMYILYPRFMPLLFLLAGISARYSLQKKSGKEWFKSRSRKLLIPATIGLFVFQWITGYFNTQISSVAQGIDLTAGVPGIAKYIMWAISGIWPLWFIQLLWKSKYLSNYLTWNTVLARTKDSYYRLNQSTCRIIQSLQTLLLHNSFFAVILRIFSRWSTRESQKIMDSIVGLSYHFMSRTNHHYLGTGQFRASISQ